MSCPRNKHIFRCDQNGPPARRKEGAYPERYVTDEQRSRRPIFIATLRAAASWLFFRVARSSRIDLDMIVARALKNSQPTCGERHAYFGDRTLAGQLLSWFCSISAWLYLLLLAIGDAKRTRMRHCGGSPVGVLMRNAVHRPLEWHSSFCQIVRKVPNFVVNFEIIAGKDFPRSLVLVPSGRELCARNRHTQRRDRACGYGFSF